MRSEDIDQLYNFRFFIADLSAQLADRHQSLVTAGVKTVIVYRGGKMSMEEIEKFKENRGKLISMNGFFPTSWSRAVAMNFALKRTRRSDRLPTLFEIDCDLQKLGESVIFADIHDLSDYPSEQEVLFDLSSVFQLNDIVLDENQCYLIKMSASAEGQSIARHFIDITCREIKENSVAIMFGRLLCQMGAYEKSQKYFERMRENPSGEDPAWIEFNIGRALHYKSDYDSAEKCYRRAYGQMLNADPPRITDSAYALNSIGTLHQINGKYATALEYFGSALRIYQEAYSSNHPKVTYSLHSIGSVLHQQGRYDEALQVHERALKIRQSHWTNGHPDIAYSFNNIGHVLASQQKYAEAMECYKKAWKIREKYYHSEHPDIAFCLHNIGSILIKQGKYHEALDVCKQALHIREKQFPDGHPDVASSLFSIGDALQEQKNVEEALDFYHRALVIREDHQLRDHRITADLLFRMATAYEHVGQPMKALRYYQEALSIYELNPTADDDKKLQIKGKINAIK